MKDIKNSLKKKTIIILGILATLFISTYNIVQAEDNGNIPTIVLNNVSEVVYVTDSSQNFTYSGTIQNYNPNVQKVVWTITEYTDVNEALAWAQNETRNCTNVTSGNFTVNLNNFIVSEETKVYFYPLEINYENVSTEGTSLMDGNPNGTLYKVYNPYILTFVPDKEPPRITEISTNEQVSNYWFIPFSKLYITVRAEDTETTVNEIRLYIKKISKTDRLNGVDIENIAEDILTQKINGGQMQAVFDYDFLPNDYEYIISALAIDANNNESGRVYLTDSEVGVVYENQKPQISIKPEDEVIYQSGDVYYDREHQSFVITIEDEVSGVQRLSIKINGADITEQYNTGTEIPDQYTNWGIRNLSFVINTSQVNPNPDNAYKIEVTATDFAGNMYADTKTLQIDEKAPEIERMTWSQNSYDKSLLDDEANKYENFSNDNALISIKAIDDIKGSGVKAIKYYTKDNEGNSTEVKTIDVNDSGEIYIKMAPNFKGFVYATAVDRLGNETEEYVTMSGLVLETEESHNSQEHIELSLQPTSKIDNQGNPLYSGDTSATIVVTDEYAGIQSIEWSVTAPNDGNKNVSGNLEVKSDGTISNDSWEVLKTDLNMVTEVKATIPINHNSNDIVIKVTITDNVGNTSEKEAKLSIDKTPPVIQIAFDGKVPDATYTDVYNSARTATITIKERNFSASLMNKTITNSLGVIPEISGWREARDAGNPDNTTYTATVTFAQDGDYTFAMSGSDLAGNQSQNTDIYRFTIDQTLPVISVTYSQHGASNQNYYSADRVVTISVKERNFAPERVNMQSFNLNNEALASLPTLGAWTQLGDTYTTSIVLRNDGIYSFTFDVTDKAGNKAAQYQSERFIIDKTFPEIIISNVDDKSANNGEVAPVIQLSDINLDSRTMVISLIGVNSGTADLEGWYIISTDKRTITFEDFPHEKSVDDLYELNVSVTDMAGNTTTESITFSVNRFGSVYVFNKALKETGSKYVQSASGLALTEVNVDSLVDDTIRLVLTVNGVPTTLSEGSDYLIDVNGDEGSWRNYTYSLDNRLFENDGTYILTVYSVDRAGNRNQNTDQTKEAEIEFGVDTTNPVIIPTNLESGATYNETVYRANIAIKDNLVLDYVEVYINGINVNVNEDGENFTFDIPEANESRNIRIVAVDAAGNKEEYVVEDVWVTTNFFVRWYNNKPVFVASLVIGFGIILAIILLLIKNDKRKTK